MTKRFDIHECKRIDIARYDAGIHEKDVNILICPDCFNHIYGNKGRNDCKNLIMYGDGSISQCMCYSKEHE